MFKCGWTSEYALLFVQSKRYCVSPSSVSYSSAISVTYELTSQFSTQLNEYEPIIFAQRMMALQATTSNTGNGGGAGGSYSGNRNKRGLATE
jgi:hypothetical protein